MILVSLGMLSLFNYDKEIMLPSMSAIKWNCPINFQFIFEAQHFV